MTALAILERADQILADESKWCQGAGRSGDRCCLLWALTDATRGEEERAAHSVLLYLRGDGAWHLAKEAISAHIGGPSIVAFNDRSTFRDVKAVLAAAIADLRSQS